MAEVFAFEKERFAGGLGEGVRKAIAEVESGRMASFAEVGVALTREKGVLFGDRINRNSRVAKKRVALAHTEIAAATLCDD